MQTHIEPIARMIEQLAKLPGIGSKTAQRLAFFILSMEENEVRQLAEAIYLGKKKVHACAVCGSAQIKVQRTASFYRQAAILRYIKLDYKLDYKLK